MIRDAATLLSEMRAAERALMRHAAITRRYAYAIDVHNTISLIIPLMPIITTRHHHVINNNINCIHFLP